MRPPSSRRWRRVAQSGTRYSSGMHTIVGCFVFERVDDSRLVFGQVVTQSLSGGTLCWVEVPTPLEDIPEMLDVIALNCGGWSYGRWSALSDGIKNAPISVVPYVGIRHNGAYDLSARHVHTSLRARIHARRIKLTSRPIHPIACVSLAIVRGASKSGLSSSRAI